VHKNITVDVVAKEFQVDRKTASKYLKMGTQLGWCCYDAQREISRGKMVAVFKHEQLIEIFDSITKLADSSEKLFGKRLKSKDISYICNGKKPNLNGYRFEFVN
jgi:hypothetical protein